MKDKYSPHGADDFDRDAFRSGRDVLRINESNYRIIIIGVPQYNKLKLNSTLPREIDTTCLLT